METTRQRTNTRIFSFISLLETMRIGWGAISSRIMHLVERIFPEKKNGMLPYIIREHKLPYSNPSDTLKSEVVVDEGDEKIIVDSTEKAVKIFREIWEEDMIGLQENLYALYLNASKNLLGSKLISAGTTTLSNADPELILFYAHKLEAEAVIIAHNHPSGVNKASESDIIYTKEVNEALRESGIKLLDHIILTARAHYSYKEKIGF
ncbi:JAB domain-containing protein [Rubrolithibacter danxiaensis]|uniref:JAB domain-containing protein n=1 Tax=Rubrolithibacter danxiaensis TaxID=3390805 RepID=UPI003BF8104D